MLEYSQGENYWPNYAADVTQWVRECEQRQRRNPPLIHRQAPLGMINASHPFQKVTWDSDNTTLFSYQYLPHWKERAGICSFSPI